MINKDPGKRHFYISLVKSCLRIIAAVALISAMFITAGILLILAEILGIAEEI